MRNPFKMRSKPRLYKTGSMHKGLLQLNGQSCTSALFLLGLIRTLSRKINLDADFARKLQALDDEGEDIDPVKDAERYRDLCVSSLRAVLTLSQYTGHRTRGRRSQRTEVDCHKQHRQRMYVFILSTVHSLKPARHLVGKDVSLIVISDPSVVHKIEITQVERKRTLCTNHPIRNIQP